MRILDTFEEREFDIKELLQVVCKRIWIIFTVGIAAAIILFLVSNYVLEKKYEATTQIYVMSKETGSKDVTYPDIQISSDLIKDYMILATSRLVTEQIIKELGLDINHENLVKLIHIENPDETRVLNIKVQYNDPVKAKMIADAIREKTSNVMAGIIGNEYVSKIVEANLPESPITPNVKKNIVLGGALGILGSVFICLLMYMADDTIKTADDVEKYLDISVLSTIQVHKKKTFQRKIMAKTRRIKEIVKKSLVHRRKSRWN